VALSEKSATATSRIKDLPISKACGRTSLIGYGDCVGLTGTGDTLTTTSPSTKKSRMGELLERMGVKFRGATIRTGHVAAVMVTGNLPR